MSAEVGRQPVGVSCPLAFRGMELRWSALAERTLTHWVIMPTRALLIFKWNLPRNKCPRRHNRALFMPLLEHESVNNYFQGRNSKIRTKHLTFQNTHNFNSFHWTRHLAFIICRGRGGCTLHLGMHWWPKDDYQESALPFQHVIPGTECRSPSSAVSTLTFWVTSLAFRPDIDELIYQIQCKIYN